MIASLAITAPSYILTIYRYNVNIYTMNGCEQSPGQNRPELVSVDTIEGLLMAVNEKAAGLPPPEPGELGISLRHYPDVEDGLWCVDSREKPYGLETEGMIALVIERDPQKSEPENVTSWSFYRRDGVTSLYKTSPASISNVLDGFQGQAPTFEDMYKMAGEAMKETQVEEIAAGFADVYEDEAQELLARITGATLLAGGR